MVNSKPIKLVKPPATFTLIQVSWLVAGTVASVRSSVNPAVPPPPVPTVIVPDRPLKVTGWLSLLMISEVPPKVTVEVMLLTFGVKHTSKMAVPFGTVTPVLTLGSFQDNLIEPSGVPPTPGLLKFASVKPAKFRFFTEAKSSWVELYVMVYSTLNRLVKLVTFTFWHTCWPTVPVASVISKVAGPVVPVPPETVMIPVVPFKATVWLSLFWTCAPEAKETVEVIPASFVVKQTSNTAVLLARVFPVAGVVLVQFMASVPGVEELKEAAVRPVKLKFLTEAKLSCVVL